MVSIQLSYIPVLSFIPDLYFSSSAGSFTSSLSSMLSILLQPTCQIFWKVLLSFQTEVPLLGPPYHLGASYQNSYHSTLEPDCWSGFSSRLKCPLGCAICLVHFGTLNTGCFLTADTQYIFVVYLHPWKALQLSLTFVCHLVLLEFSQSFSIS